MKHLRYLLVIAIATVTLHAQARILTVSNNPAIVAQYANWESAIDAAMDGDTLFFHRSGTNYTQNSDQDHSRLSKRLVLIGEGYNSPKSVGGELAPKLNYIYMRGGASGSVIMGFDIVGLITTRATVNDVLITKNRINFYVGFEDRVVNNWIITENVFESNDNTNARGIIDATQAQNIIITNNIFGKNAHIDGLSDALVLLENNVFVGGADAADRSFVFSECNAIDVRNNIFYRREVADGITNSTFQNNIFFETDFDPALGIDVPPNLQADPQFVSYPADATGDFPRIPPYDFRVAPSSPAINAATNPQENIGLMKSVVPYQAPFLPYITRLNVLNKLVSTGDNLQIQLQVKYPDQN